MLISSILCSFLPLCISGGPKKKRRGKEMNEKRKQLTVYLRLVPGAGCSFDLFDDQGWLPSFRGNGQLTQFFETPHSPHLLCCCNLQLVLLLILMSADVDWMYSSGEQEERIGGHSYCVAIVNNWGWAEGKLKSRERRESKDWMMFAFSAGSTPVKAELWTSFSFWSSLLYHALRMNMDFAQFCF